MLSASEFSRIRVRIGVRLLFVSSRRRKNASLTVTVHRLDEARRLIAIDSLQWRRLPYVVSGCWIVGSSRIVMFGMVLVRVLCHFNSKVIPLRQLYGCGILRCGVSKFSQVVGLVSHKIAYAIKRSNLRGNAVVRVKCKRCNGISSRINCSFLLLLGRSGIQPSLGSEGSVLRGR